MLNAKKFGDMEVPLLINNVMNNSIQRDQLMVIVDWIKLVTMSNAILSMT